MLDGYGPIPPSMARQLIADGAESFHRVLIDPRDGAPLEIGRTSYRVTKAQRRWLRLRDGKCPFPGCSNQSLDNEADHVLAWANGGTTGISNLGQPCRRHHRLRHTTAWKPPPQPPAKTNHPAGSSPAGRRYQSEHPDWEPPTWPKGLSGNGRVCPQKRAQMPGPCDPRTRNMVEAREPGLDAEMPVESGLGLGPTLGFAARRSASAMAVMAGAELVAGRAEPRRPRSSTSHHCLASCAAWLRPQIGCHLSRDLLDARIDSYLPVRPCGGLRPSRC